MIISSLEWFSINIAYLAVLQVPLQLQHAQLDKFSFFPRLNQSLFKILNFYHSHN